jgi:hypothetical protein
LELIKIYLGSGKIYIKNKGQINELIIQKFSVIKNIIIPLLDKTPIHGVKQLDYLD